MIENYTNDIKKRLTAILTSAPPKTSAALRDFIHAFFAHAPLDELQSLSEKEAVSLAISAHTFMVARKNAAPKIQFHTSASSTIHIMLLNDDMPFLVDSLSALLIRLGCKIEHTLHPIFAVTRDSKGTLINAASSDDAHADIKRESLMVFSITALPVGLSEKALSHHIARVLEKVRVSVRDWKVMTRITRESATMFERNLGNVARGLSDEIKDFLLWLANKNFVLLGVGQYDIVSSKHSVSLKKNAKESYGLYSLKESDSVQTDGTPIEYSALTTASGAIEITKSSEPCEVHRAVPMDFITIKRFNAKGQMIGETRLLGLFTSSVYYQTTDAIPLIRRKVARAIDRSGFDPISHNGKSLKAVLEFMPRDELFQLSDEALFSLGMGIQALEARPKVRLFTRVDAFERYVSCIIYIPRERFTTSLREKVEALLESAYAGRVITFFTQVSDSPLARVNILISTTPSKVPTPKLSEMEAAITSLTNAWRDRLNDAYVESCAPVKAQASFARYADAFPSNYINNYTALNAVFDTRRIDDALSGDGLSLELYRLEDDQQSLHLKCYTTDIDSTLSDIVPLLENMGAQVVDVHPYLITPKDAPKVLIRDFILRLNNAQSFDIVTHKTRIESALRSIWRTECNNDALNGLLFLTKMSARDIDILRTLSRYMRQINFVYGQAFIAKALLAHAPIAAQLAALFDTKFNPAIKSRDGKISAATLALMAALDSITNLAEDRVLRRMMELIDAAIRTNAYQTTDTGTLKPYISIKFLCAKIPELPLPKPMVEIFVYSMRTEGIHLRGDKVARGGLRWSDRPEDFRTEVLGLVKAQMVKNVVIVPQGSKGGFFVKRASADRDAYQREGIECYKEFLRGLLDITDNIVGAKIVPPKNVIRYDNDDPYLVVAADKGTTTFSDIANSVSAEYGFWLSDAFASGGSAGYDHKQMAITARGGWVAVTRHFREMGRDITREPFTCVGIGDMSGDVFGNGMLLSDTMQLLAAFNHKHIFFDPTPDAKKSFVERKRLFALPRSGWSDYNPALISTGGGVFDRSLKSISLSKEVQAALGTTVKAAAPDELISLILKAPVDLLWNGGIGTYVKASEQTHDEVGDRANNGLRVNGEDLRCKIVGEGGNLGFTQRGRIEYARTGGRINTDAIDNSAGVDCSDHEVNIKIALSAAMGAKRLTLAARNTLLKSMTNDVAHLVLEDNRLQTQALSLAQAQGAAIIDPVERFMHDLEKQGLLNRAVEYLPNDKQLAELKAQNIGFSRPELSVLLAYSKMALYRDIVSHTGLDDAMLEADLLRYFPHAMQSKFRREILTHRLRREIIATIITNQIVNRLGITFVHALTTDTGASAADIIDAYLFIRETFGIDELWENIEILDGVIAANTQNALFLSVQEFINDTVRFVLDNLPRPLPLAALTARYAKPIAHLQSAWQDIADEGSIRRTNTYIAAWNSAGVPVTLAQSIGALTLLRPACAIVSAAQANKYPVDTVAAIYFALANALDLSNVEQRIAQLPRATHWQRLAIASALTQLSQFQQQLLSNVLREFGAKPTAAASWLKAKDSEFKRYQRFMVTFMAQEIPDTSMLVVALREISLLAE